jgi:hypothetical protein
MKTYKRHRTPKELKKACKEAGFPYSQRKFDRGESDYVSFTFKHGQATLKVVISTFNGMAMGEVLGVKGITWFSTSSEEHDRKHWMKALLDFIYTNEELPPTRRSGKKAASSSR